MGKLSSREEVEYLVEPVSRQVFVDWIEVWRYRELLWAFVLRDFKLRYRHTVVGVAWAVIQPITTMIIFTIFFNVVAGFSSGGIPYPVFTFTALVAWSFFATTLTSSAESLTNNSIMLKHVFFPRVIIPLSYILGGLVDLVLSLVVLLGLLAVYRLTPLLAAVVIIPYMTLLMLLTVIGVGLVLASINVTYRDVRHIVPFLVQIWLFSTPVAYSITKFPEQFRPFLGINPMTSVVEGFRLALTSSGDLTISMVILSTISALLLFGIGVIVFQRFERNFVDIL